MDDSVPQGSIETLEQALDAMRQELAECRASASRTSRDLGERVKELTCLYAVSSLLERSANFTEILEGVANSLVPAYQFPEITSARIRLNGHGYATPGLVETPWRQAAILKLENMPVGTVEVFYREERPEAAEGPFLLEERHLIDAVAEMLIRYLRRCHVEEALRENERKYRNVVESLHEGIWIIDRDCVTTFVNSRMAELLGYAIDEMLGRSVFDFVPPQSRESGRCYLAQGRAGSRGIHEIEFLRKDGTPLWTRVASTPLFDEQSNYQGALAGIVDISARKRAEAALAESEERFRRQAAELEAIYWWTPIGLAVFDTELRFLHVNRRLAEMNGVAAEAHMGKRLAEVAPGIAPQAQGILERILATREPALNLEIEAKSPAQAGTGRYWNTHWLPLKDPAGALWGITVVVEEVTERKQREDALYRREQEFEALAERSPDIIARIDQAGCFNYVNPAVEKFSGEPRASFIGRNLADLHDSPEGQALRRRAVQDVFALRREQTLEHGYLTPAGIRWFHARLVPEFDREGEVVSVLVVDRDITEMKRVQQALEQLTLHDPLTGVANRRYLDQFIAREWRRGRRHRSIMALIMIDIDDFKAYNDHYGHPRGDDCLRQVANALETHLHRPTDLLVRYGGEEFLVVLPETGLPEARQLAEGMREAVWSLGLPHPSSPVSPVVTASFGVVAAPANTTTFAHLLAAADHALYRAKQAGRNRVEGTDGSGP